MISHKTINKILDKSVIEEVIGDFIKLKKVGNIYKGLSPFSNERTPSFIVSPSKKIWKDFSSGKGGNIISFLMNHEHFNYPQSLQYLAKKYNIELKEEKKYSYIDQEILNEKESLYIIQEYAQKFFINQLKENQKEKNIGLKYLKNRSFKEETIKKFQIGYAISDRRYFTKKAIEKGFQIKYLEKSGLSIVRNKEIFDRFRDRIIFPIHSLSGRVLGFGGRVIKLNSNISKYINSPENIIYHKSKILYGIYQAKQFILKEDSCYLVEGYTDVISLYQSGIKNVVSSSGTSLTLNQILLIKRFTINIILLYDGDSAGIKAAIRGIDLILEQEMNVRVVLFPNKEDPDSFIYKHTSSEIIKFLKEESQDFIHFKTKILFKNTENDVIKRSNIIQEIVKSISKISNLIQREVYIKETSKIIKISEQVLFQELSQIDQKIRKEKEKKNIYKKIQINVENNNEINPLEILEEELISLMLLHGEHLIPHFKNQLKKRKIIQEVIEHFHQDNIQFSNPFYQKIFKKIEKDFLKGKYRTANYFLKLNDEKLSNFISSKLIDSNHLARFDKKGIYIIPKEKKITHYFQQTLLRYKSHYISKLIKNQENNLKEKSSSEISLSLKKICKLINLKIKINKELGQEV